MENFRLDAPAFRTTMASLMASPARSATLVTSDARYHGRQARCALPDFSLVTGRAMDVARHHIPFPRFIPLDFGPTAPSGARALGPKSNDSPGHERIASRTARRRAGREVVVTAGRGRFLHELRPADQPLRHRHAG